MANMLYSSPIITAYVLVVACLLGLVMGSFINCWAWRYMHGESVLHGRSHCTSCGHALGVADLVPVFSWLFSGGKCRYCGEKVSARYPITELVCAVVFVAITAVYGLQLQTVELLAFAGILLFLSLTDLDDYLIPNECIIAALVVRAVYLAVTWALGTTTLDQILYYVGSAFGIGIALLVVVLVADRVFGRDSMGGGDLKLYFVAGFYFGWQQCLLLVIISCIFGIIVALVGAGRMPADTRDAEGADKTKAPDGADDAGEPEGLEEAGGVGEATPVLAPDAAGEATPVLALDAAGETVSAEIETKQIDQPVQADQPVQIGKVFGRTIPFGPSIAAACIVIMLVGQPMIDWYLNLLK